MVDLADLDLIVLHGYYGFIRKLSSLAVYAYVGLMQTLQCVIGFCSLSF